MQTGADKCGERGDFLGYTAFFPRSRSRLHARRLIVLPRGGQHNGNRGAGLGDIVVIRVVKWLV